MSLYFVTGGVRSGKSVFAEKLAKENGSSVLYVATGISTDPDMENRIQIHQQRRQANWGLVEEPINLTKTVERYPDYPSILIDCLSTWTTNRLLLAGDDKIRDKQTTESLFQDLHHWLAAIEKFSQPVVAVSSETGLGGVAMSPLGRWFQDVLGEVNQQVAAHAEEVYTVLSGIPVRIKP